MQRLQVNTNVNGPQEYADGRSYDAKEVKLITQQWIDSHMKNREFEFTRSTECSIFCGTWNVNAKKQEGGLHDWILPPNQPQADLYVLGFQEIVDLNAMNVALNSNNTQQRAAFWQDRIRECLDSTAALGAGRYEMVCEKFLVGLYLVIYAKESVRARIRDVRSASLGVGIMGMMGNKGGVSIRLSLFDSTLVFVCAHLAAHRENVAGRNSDYKNIYERSVFPPDGTSTSNAANVSQVPPSPYALDAPSSSERLTDSIVMPRQGAARYVDSTLAIPDHDIIFWMGDLNYRIDDSVSTEQVFERLKRDELETLRANDQLNIERSKNKVFENFQEGLLTFHPTYKYQPGTDVYETRAEKKLRAPAWCDRVLWRTPTASGSDGASPTSAVKLIEYNRANLLPSDHKPVYALFRANLKQVVESKEKIVFQELVGFLNKYTSTKLPVVEVTGLKINFDKIGYEEKKTSVVTLKNNGDSIAHWRLTNKMEDVKPCKRWIQFDSMSGLLLPGETRELLVTLMVDMETAQQLNAGKDLLQDVVILRVEKSIDSYIEISAQYERSCYGVSLDELVTLMQPVATTPLPAADPEFYLRQVPSPGSPFSDAGLDSGSPTGTEPGTKLSVPKELWRLIDALWSGRALKEKDLFNSLADPAEVVAIRTALDRGLDFPAQLSPHAYVDCLTTFLKALPKPLLPPDLFPVGEVEDRQLSAFARKFLEDLPPLHYNVFVYVLSFMREVLVEDSYNRSTAALLASVCIQCMTLSIPPETAAPTDFASSNPKDFITKEDKQRRMARQAYMQRVIMHLLTTSSL